ncbi:MULTISPECIES: hypothetical protein [unclassified Bradyrhizobium]|uniref:hypothetical protein n=1 Tax=unclassified Bradyrhizobium TaxID=2631580 RepID=UPI0028E5DCC2|nr:MULTISPECIES: hypothetical protein [unclassified Bradyrhizobium]
MIVNHPCKCCGAPLVYELRTNRRVYCDGCRISSRKKSQITTQRMRDARFGRSNRGSIRGRIAQIEREELAR